MGSLRGDSAGTARTAHRGLQRPEGLRAAPRRRRALGRAGGRHPAPCGRCWHTGGPASPPAPHRPAPPRRPLLTPHGRRRRRPQRGPGGGRGAAHAHSAPQTHPGAPRGGRAAPLRNRGVTEMGGGEGYGDVGGRWGHGLERDMGQVGGRETGKRGDRDMGRDGDRGMGERDIGEWDGNWGARTGTKTLGMGGGMGGGDTESVGTGWGQGDWEWEQGHGERGTGWDGDRDTGTRTLGMGRGQGCGDTAGTGWGQGHWEWDWNGDMRTGTRGQ